MTDIYQLLILRLVIGKAASFIASVMGFIVHSLYCFPCFCNKNYALHIYDTKQMNLE